MFLIRGVFLSFIFNVKISFLINFNNFLIKKCYIKKKDMKNLIILPEALAIREASMSFGNKFQAVKLTFEQAMSFKEEFSSFEEMLEFYGPQNRLGLGEYYDGYIAVYYDGWKYHSVVRMRGVVFRINERQCMVFASENGGTCAGLFKYVWTFNGCRFADNLRDLRRLGNAEALQIKSDPDDLEKSLKEKLINALVKNIPVELTDEENFALQSYGPDYYSQFFVRRS